MRKLAVITALAVAAFAGPAWAQANLRPDPVPRVPPQPGQSLPVEDVEFLRAAAAVSSNEAQLTKIGSQVEHSGVKQLSQRMAQNHQALRDELGKLAQARGVDLSKPQAAVADQGGLGGGASAVTNSRNSAAVAEQAVRRLSDLKGQEIAGAYVEEQLAVHNRLVDLYQTQASNTTDNALASFAIKALVGIQQERDALRQVAGEFGIAVDEKGQPPQYGSAAGARKEQ